MPEQTYYSCLILIIKILSESERFDIIREKQQIKCALFKAILPPSYTTMTPNAEAVSTCKWPHRHKELLLYCTLSGENLSEPTSRLK